MSEQVESGPRYPEIEVQMSGQDGNAFFIIGRVQAALRRSGLPQEALDEFRIEAESGDHDHVLQTCMAWVTCE